MFPEERSRIEKAGGHVTADGRLNGRMQVKPALILHAQEGISYPEGQTIGQDARLKLMWVRYCMGCSLGFTKQ